MAKDASMLLISKKVGYGLAAIPWQNTLREIRALLEKKDHKHE